MNSINIAQQFNSKKIRKSIYKIGDFQVQLGQFKLN